MSERELSSASRKAELFDNLLSSIESQYCEQFESLERAKWDEWKKNGPRWQKEVISEALILKYRIRIADRIPVVRDANGMPLDLPFLSEIRNKVWIHFENLPPKETKDVGRDQVVNEFKRVVSTMDISQATKEAYLESLKKPFSSNENKFRKVVGLNPLQGEENGHKEV